MAQLRLPEGTNSPSGAAIACSCDLETPAGLQGSGDMSGSSPGIRSELTCAGQLPAERNAVAKDDRAIDQCAGSRDRIHIDCHSSRLPQSPPASGVFGLRV